MPLLAISCVTRALRASQRYLCAIPGEGIDSHVTIQLRTACGESLAVPTDTTNRLWVKKTGLTGTHEIMFRGQEGSNAVDLVGVAENFLDATSGLVYEGDTWVSARYAAAGDNLSFPVVWTPMSGSNSSAYDPWKRPFFVDWVGRGLDGRRVRWSIQGAVQAPDNTYRFVEGENPGADAGIAALVASTSILATVSGSVPVIYHYADCGYNAYQQRKNRRS
jgi:hypothetical protein